jgi:hypothetical protein
MRADNYDTAGGILAHAGECAGERAMLMQSSQVMAVFGVLDFDEPPDLRSTRRCCS